MRTLATLCVILLISTGCVTSRETDRTTLPGLRILLTNDDGYLSPGIRAVRAALEGAGHDVTLVAPLENRSGSSSSLTTAGTLGLREQGPRTWSVGGTPADAVRVGLGVVMKGAEPDLVVSGANFGQNIGPATLVSGTVGAALTAMQLGYPSIAISVGIDRSEMRADPRFASTLAAFDDAASFVARTILELQAAPARGGSLLPEHTVLNINYPAREAADVAGVVWANIGRGSHLDFGFERAGADTVRIAFQGGGSIPETIEDADTTFFDDGYVTLTLLDGDMIAPAALINDVDLRLGDVAP
jgi:5'-nucleotidase